MALKATIYKFQAELSDMDRNLYGDSGEGGWQGEGTYLCEGGWPDVAAKDSKERAGRDASVGGASGRVARTISYSVQGNERSGPLGIDRY